MVRLLRRAAGPGLRGKLGGDRGIETAAVALLNGYDPLAFLGLGPDDTRIATAVLSRAQEIRAEYDRQLAEYVAGKTAQGINTWLAKNLPKLVPRHR